MVPTVLRPVAEDKYLCPYATSLHFCTECVGKKIIILTKITNVEAYLNCIVFLSIHQSDIITYADRFCGTFAEIHITSRPTGLVRRIDPLKLSSNHYASNAATISHSKQLFLPRCKIVAFLYSGDKSFAKKSRRITYDVDLVQTHKFFHYFH